MHGHTGSSGHAGTFLADLAAEGGAERLAAEVTTALPALDIVVLVAGADVLTGEAATWDFQHKLDALLTIDVVATMALTRAVGRWMAERTGGTIVTICLLYTSPSPRDGLLSRMPSSA